MSDSASAASSTIILNFKNGIIEGSTNESGNEPNGVSKTYRQYLMVHLPCFVRTVESALSMLGHSPTMHTAAAPCDSIGATINSSKTLHIRFPNSGDPFRHEIQTHPHQGAMPRNGLIVRMRKHKRTGKTEVAVVGGVTKGFAFDQPADFHVLMIFVGPA